ncbi:hypothetical protein [Candidatus Harpocratesius sp.]
MSLKERIPKIYEHYGLSEAELDVYTVVLKYTQVTVSEIAGILNKNNLMEIQPIVDKLEQLKFIHKIPGIVDRYIPLEPYLELFEKEALHFRDVISEIKDNVLSDQASRFENLEDSEKSTTEQVKSFVETQISDVFRESDQQDVEKKTLIENAINRYTETSNELEKQIEQSTFQARDEFESTRIEYTEKVKKTTEDARDRLKETCKNVEDEIQKGLFLARDRFQETSTNVENEIQNIMYNSRDRYEKTSLDLEKDLHEHIDHNYDQFKNAVNSHDSQVNQTIDDHITKFKTDKENFNAQIDDFTSLHKTQYQEFETEMHGMIDTLNQDLKQIAEEFKQTYDNTTVDHKNVWNQIVDDILKDFSERVNSLENECKQQLDEHVELHKENVSELHPKVKETLEKYLMRMKNVVDDLKNEFSNLLTIQIENNKHYTEKIQNDIKERVETRHSELAGQVLAFKNAAIELMDNLKDTSDRYEGLAHDLAKRGSAWKALLFGKHKKFLENYKEIQERVGKISGSMKANFEESTASYIQKTGETTTQIKQDIDSIVSAETQKMTSEINALDTKQKETLGLELEDLAHDLNEETTSLFQMNVEHCQTTTTQLKDKLESSLHSHHDDFELAFNKHRQNVLKFSDESNSTANSKIDQWYSSMDSRHVSGKQKVTGIVQTHDQNVANYRQQVISNNNEHATLLATEMSEFKNQKRKVYDSQLDIVRKDFDSTKQTISQSLHNQIQLIKDDVHNLNSMQHQKIDEQIQFVKTEFEKLNELQQQKLDKEIELFTEEVAQINKVQQEQIDNHITKFKEIIQTLDKKQKNDIDSQISLVTEEFNKLENDLHVLLEKRKADYQEKLNNLKTDLIKTIHENIQDTKDAIADFTLNFMNSIDEAVEIAEEDVDELSAISEASRKVPSLGRSATWHVFGTQALIESIIASMKRTKSTITIITPTVEPKVLEALSQVAYEKKSARFLYTTNWDLGKYGPIVEKMKVFGNIQFRNLKGANDFYALARDGEEIVLCPKAKDEKDLIAIVSILEGYAQIFGSFIYPIFQANSRPI